MPEKKKASSTVGLELRLEEFKRCIVVVVLHLWWRESLHWWMVVVILRFAMRRGVESLKCRVVASVILDVHFWRSPFERRRVIVVIVVLGDFHPLGLGFHSLRRGEPFERRMIGTTTTTEFHLGGYGK